MNPKQNIHECLNLNYENGAPLLGRKGALRKIQELLYPYKDKKSKRLFWKRCKEHIRCKKNIWSHILELSAGILKKVKSNVNCRYELVYGKKYKNQKMDPGSKIRFLYFFISSRVLSRQFTSLISDRMEYQALEWIHSIIKYLFWQIVAGNDKDAYSRINYETAFYL